METLSIEILNHEALPLLKNLADLNLISIEYKNTNNFSSALEKLRSKSAIAPSLEEITKEVELARSKRYGQ